MNRKLAPLKNGKEAGRKSKLAIGVIEIYVQIPAAPNLKTQTPSFVT